MGKYIKRKAPVNVGQVIQAKCEGIGVKGAGMFKKDGFIIFVEEAREGSEYEIQITKVFSKVAFGEIVQNIN